MNFLWHLSFSSPLFSERSSTDTKSCAVIKRKTGSPVHKCHYSERQIPYLHGFTSLSHLMPYNPPVTRLFQCFLGPSSGLHPVFILSSPETKLKSTEDGCSIIPILSIYGNIRTRHTTLRWGLLGCLISIGYPLFSFERGVVHNSMSE